MVAPGSVTVGVPVRAKHRGQRALEGGRGAPSRRSRSAALNPALQFLRASLCAVRGSQGEPRVEKTQRPAQRYEATYCSATCALALNDNSVLPTRRDEARVSAAPASLPYRCHRLLTVKNLAETPRNRGRNKNCTNRGPAQRHPATPRVVCTTSRFFCCRSTHPRRTPQEHSPGPRQSRIMRDREAKMRCTRPPPFIHAGSSDSHLRDPHMVHWSLSKLDGGPRALPGACSPIMHHGQGRGLHPLACVAPSRTPRPAAGQRGTSLLASSRGQMHRRSCWVGHDNHWMVSEAPRRMIGRC